MSRIVNIASVIFFAGVSMVMAQDAGDVFQKYEARVSKAVDLGFEYLLSVEQPDGSFPESHGRSTGISSLVGMSFLAKGHVPGQGRYGEAINRRIDYALKHTSDEGLIDCGDHGNGPMYAHNISALFLSEVSGMVDKERQEKLDVALAKSIQVILRAQAVPKSENHRGGWRYQPNSNDSDLSCSGWALMALRSARLNGAPVPPQAITDAVDYTLRNMERKIGHFGYMDQYQHKDSLTGAGLMCLELCGRHATPENLLDSGQPRKPAARGIRVLRQLLQCPGHVPAGREVLENLCQLDVSVLFGAAEGGRFLAGRALRPRLWHQHDDPGLHRPRAPVADLPAGRARG